MPRERLRRPPPPPPPCPPAHPSTPGLHNHGDHAQTGRGLGITVGTWSPAPTSYSYQWQRKTGSGGSISPVRHGNSYTPGVADLGVHLQAQVTGHNAYGSQTVTASISGTVASGAPVNTVPPTISGTATLGDKLGISTSTWSPAGTPSYLGALRQSSSCAAISGATAASYVAARPMTATRWSSSSPDQRLGHTSVTTAPTATVAS